MPSVTEKDLYIQILKMALCFLEWNTKLISKNLLLSTPEQYKFKLRRSTFVFLCDFFSVDYSSVDPHSS